MRHFENPNDGNKVYGYDSQDATQAGLLQAAIDGKWVEVTGSWPPAPTDVELADAARSKRANLLSACDWTVLPDAPLTAAQQTAWKAYRQALRDVTAQAGFPQVIDWPVAP